MDLRNEITRFMDSRVREGERVEDDFPHVYVFANPDGVPAEFEDGDERGWYVRFPGYTCGNVRFSPDGVITRVVLTRRGGGFSGGNETIFTDPDGLERELNEKFAGRNVSEFPFEEKR